MMRTTSAGRDLSMASKSKEDEVTTWRSLDVNAVNDGSSLFGERFGHGAGGWRRRAVDGRMTARDAASGEDVGVA